MSLYCSFVILFFHYVKCQCVQCTLLLLKKKICLFNLAESSNIPQSLHFFILNKTFWRMFIPFFTSFQVVFPLKFLMNYSCNIIVPSLVLLLCQLFTFAHKMRYCFTFLVTRSTKWWLGYFIYLEFHIVCSNCLFLRGTKYGFRFNFQVSSSQLVPCLFFIRCSWHFSYKLFTHSFVFP